MADKGEIVLVMDGSQTGPANTTLMLSVMCRGFAVPVAWVVKKGEKGHFPEEMHTDLVKMVAHFCPPGFRIVLLGDGEFDFQGLRQWCVENNWLFVVRTSSDRLIYFDGEVARFDSLRTTRSICFIGGTLPLANAVYWRGKGHSKPLFLLTYLELGHEACHYYKRRFKIETLFKHLRSGVFIKEKEPVERLEVILRKDRLPKIDPIAIAQLAIRNDCDCVVNFFSELSKNFNEVFT